jgi:hypothetical protein
VTVSAMMVAISSKYFVKLRVCISAIKASRLRLSALSFDVNFWIWLILLIRLPTASYFSAYDCNYTCVGLQSGQVVIAHLQSTVEHSNVCLICQIILYWLDNYLFHINNSFASVLLAGKEISMMDSICWLYRLYRRHYVCRYVWDTCWNFIVWL